MSEKEWCKKQAVHVAVVVDDIQSVLENYCRLFQMEMPARAKQGFLRFGNLRVEFLEPDEKDSTWREYLDKHGNIVHHVAFDVEDMDEAVSVLVSQGMPVVQDGSYNGGKYAYVESENKLGVMLELLQNDK